MLSYRLLHRRTRGIPGAISFHAPWLCVLFYLLGFREASAQVRSVPQAGIPGGGYTIAGTVVNKADGYPLARARVLLRDVKKPQTFQSVVTSEGGNFQFSGLAAGKFSLSGMKRGFIPSAYEQHGQFSTAIVTGAGIDTDRLVLRLPPMAVIRGKVLDEVGEPVRHARITAYFDDHSLGVSQIHEIRSAETDDQGAYEITPLMPGTYFISAQAEPWYAIHPNSASKDQRETPAAVDRSLDVAYPLTYYPDTTEADGAIPIP